jgi:microsomal epoxide hydrolase
MEFLDVIEPLTNLEKFGGRAAASFTVVIPSLPGFGFSSKPTKGPIAPTTTARLWHKLMTEVLGYSRYGAQGGDLASLVTTRLAHQYPDALIGIHLNIIPTAASAVAENADEQAWQQQVQQFTQAEMTYLGLQATKLQTPSFALMDSPLGTAAWIIEKMKAWSDSADSIEDAFSKNQILSNVMLYLVTATIDSSI